MSLSNVFEGTGTYFFQRLYIYNQYMKDNDNQTHEIQHIK